MAQRFGGKFSPDNARVDPAHPFDGKAPAPKQGRTNLLFAAPFAFLFPAFTGPASGLVLNLAAFAGLILAAWLTRDGVIAHAAYDARKIARRPAIPRKIFGSVLTGAALAVGAFATQGAILSAAAIGVIGAALHLFAFGPDPLTDKGAEGIDKFETDRVARAVDEGEAYLKAMKDAVLRANDRGIEARVDHFSAAARQMFRQVESDPRDLTAARKYLSVYLMGARDAAVKFADIYARTRDPQAKADFEALLTDLETHFASRTQALLTDNRADLDIEIGVLRERLMREG
jgi:hypothetical protein